MPIEVIHALARIKLAAAKVNASKGLIKPEIAEPSSPPRDEVIDGKLDDQFPLVVWQTGSGTQSNMNVNEVIANRANERLGAPRGVESAGASQRSRQSRPVVERQFPTAIHIAGALAISEQAAARRASGCMRRWTPRPKKFANIVKIGRTHLQDATPVTLGQEFSGYAAQAGYAASAHRKTLCPIFWRWRRAARRSAPASIRRGLRRGGRRRYRGADRPAFRHGAQ